MNRRGELLRVVRALGLFTTALPSTRFSALRAQGRPRVGETGTEGRPAVGAFRVGERERVAGAKFEGARGRERVGSDETGKTATPAEEGCARDVRSIHSNAQSFQAAFADAVNAAEFFRTNSCTLSGPCPVSVRTSSDIRS